MTPVLTSTSTLSMVCTFLALTHPAINSCPQTVPPPNLLGFELFSYSHRLNIYPFLLHCPNHSSQSLSIHCFNSTLSIPTALTPTRPSFISEMFSELLCPISIPSSLPKTVLPNFLIHHFTHTPPLAQNRIPHFYIIEY